MKTILALLFTASIGWASFGETMVDLEPKEFLARFDTVQPATGNLSDSAAYYLQNPKSDWRSFYSANRTCYAYTNCFSGRTISCWAAGTNTCSYQWAQNSYVSCTAYNIDGTYQTFYQSC